MRKKWLIILTMILTTLLTACAGEKKEEVLEDNLKGETISYFNELKDKQEAILSPDESVMKNVELSSLLTRASVLEDGKTEVVYQVNYEGEVDGELKEIGLNIYVDRPMFDYFKEKAEDPKMITIFDGIKAYYIEEYNEIIFKKDGATYQLSSYDMDYDTLVTTAHSLSYDEKINDFFEYDFSKVLLPIENVKESELLTEDKSSVASVSYDFLNYYDENEKVELSVGYYSMYNLKIFENKENFDFFIEMIEDEGAKTEVVSLDVDKSAKYAYNKDEKMSYIFLEKDGLFYMLENDYSFGYEDITEDEIKKESIEIANTLK